MNKQELLMALKAVVPGIAKNETILPGADSICFQEGQVKTYNDNLSVLYPLDSGIECSVKAEELIRVLEKMSGLDITLKVEKKSLKITDGTTSLSLLLIESDTAERLASLKLEELDWKDLPEGFSRSLTLCMASVSNNLIHGPLTGIRVNGNDFLSSDNFRATWVVLPEEMEPFTIPGASVKDLLKIPNLGQYAVTNAWVHFMSESGAVFSSRIIASNFPEDGLKKMFPKSDKSTFSVPVGMENAIDRVGVLAYTMDDGRDYITITPEKDHLIVSGERQFGSIKEKVKMEDGQWPDGIQINVQPKYFLDILTKTRNFQMADHLIYFHDKDFKHIISTIMVG